MQNVLYEFMKYFHLNDLIRVKDLIFSFAFDFYLFYNCSSKSIFFFSYVLNDTNDDNIKKCQAHSSTSFNLNLKIVTHDFFK